jgi:hypothetical protein
VSPRPSTSLSHPSEILTPVDLSTPCVLWTGATNGRYGQKRHNGRVAYVHRLAWEQRHGPIPQGMTIDHLCLTKLCTNVLHMELVTREVNGSRANPRQTHCNQGHPMKLYGGRWQCAECSRRRHRAYYHEGRYRAR